MRDLSRCNFTASENQLSLTEINSCDKVEWPEIEVLILGNCQIGVSFAMSIIPINMWIIVDFWKSIKHAYDCRYSCEYAN